MLGRLRERYQRAMRPLGEVLARTGITPNMITVLTVLLAGVAAYLFYVGNLMMGLVFMILTVVLDMFDGAVARAAGLSSPFGATLDHTLDRYTEFLFMFGLMAGPVGPTGIGWWPVTAGDTFVPWFWGYVALFGMIMASFTRAKAESVGGVERCTVGVAERQEKLLLQFAGILLLALPPTNVWMDVLNLLPNIVHDIFVALQVTNILTLCVVMVAVLSHITVLQRLLYTREHAPASLGPAAATEEK